MAHTVRLRKCGEHPDCQLESVNDGPFEHTPRDRTVEERFRKSADRDRQEEDLSAGIVRATNLAVLLEKQRSSADDMLRRIEHEMASLPRLAELQRELRSLVSKADALSSRLEQQDARAEEIINRGEAQTERLPSVSALLTEADRTRLRLAGNQKAVEAQESRLQRMTDSAASLLDGMDGRVREIKDTEARIAKILADAEEGLSKVSERVGKVEELLGHLDGKRDQFNRIDELFAAVDELRNLLKVETEAWSKKSIRLEADIKHEREERVQGHGKTQRQIQMLSERIADA